MNTHIPQQCESCPVNPLNRDTAPVRHGLDASGSDFVIALAGNPNVGKSTVFNSLTGLRQHTGNWPGKTVTRAEGSYSFGGKRYKVIDLPGTYSLLSTSTDEEIARDCILFGKPDVTVVVADATRLERNMNLVLQVLEITDKAVLALNLIDEARRHGISVDERTLMKELGIPVVPMIARTGEGLVSLLQSIQDVASGQFVCKPKRGWTRSGKLKKAVDNLASKLQSAYPDLANVRWVALRLLEGDQRIAEAVKSGEFVRFSSSRGEPVGHNEEVKDHVIA